MSTNIGLIESNIIENRIHVNRGAGTVCVGTPDSELAKGPAKVLRITDCNTCVVEATSVNNCVTSEAHLRIPVETSIPTLEGKIREYWCKREVIIVEYETESMSKVRFSGVPRRVFREEKDGYVDIDFEGVHIELY